MKFTCLSRGGGFQFPPCHILNVCGFRILVDCPLDVSAITIFSPLPNDFRAHADNGDFDRRSGEFDTEVGYRKRPRVEEAPAPSDLVFAEPWYKTVKTLHLWDVSFIDIVLISSPMGMLGLPFLTRNKGFSAKIYVTEATAKIGQLMMEDLVSMHMEFRQFYGPHDSGSPEWIKQLELEDAPSALREIAFGKSNEDLGSWMPLYSAADVKDCVRMVQTLRFGEETCYNGTFIVKAFSSGLDIGACNWSINGPKRNISYISGSIIVSSHAMDFDYQALRGNDVILYSDFSSMHNMEGIETAASTLSDNCEQGELAASLLINYDSIEEMEKLDFICSCTVDSAKAGGSVLVTISRIGTFLHLLEHMSHSLESSSLKVPIYVISSVAEELLAFTNTIPEWVCKSRLEKFISGEPLFGHAELLKEKKIHLFPAIHSSKLIASWEEPCIVFAPHWSLRLGPSVHLLRHWSGDSRSLLVLEDGADAHLALLPFKPMAMKVLQCSFLSGIKLQKIQSLLEILRPKLAVLPDVVNQQIGVSDVNPYSVLHYSENTTLRVPSFTDGSEAEITTELASQLNWRKLKHESIAVARLKGEVFMEHSKHKLVSGSEPEALRPGRRLRHWGSLPPEKLLATLMETGIHGSIEREIGQEESENSGVICIRSPKNGLIEMSETGTLITTDDENLAALIFRAIDGALDGV